MDKASVVANDQKMPSVPEVSVQLPEITKVAATVTENGTMSGPLEAVDQRFARRRTDIVQVVLRSLCVAASATALALMLSAREGSFVSFYGFQLPVYSKWSFSDSFEYLVGASAAVTAYSLIQLIITSAKLLRKSPLTTSRYHAWLIFAADQVFAYLMMSAGSAASGVSNLNRTGIRHTTLPNFCQSLHSFCNHVAVSVVFTFFSCFLLASMAVLHVFWLSKN